MTLKETEKLRVKIDRMKLTQKEIAYELGMSEGTVSMILSGKLIDDQKLQSIKELIEKLELTNAKQS